MRNVLNKLISFVRGEEGASAAEYALILAIVTTGIAGATVLLGQNISSAISEAASCVQSQGATCS